MARPGGGFFNNPIVQGIGAGLAEQFQAPGDGLLGWVRDVGVETAANIVTDAVKGAGTAVGDALGINLAGMPATPQKTANSAAAGLSPPGVGGYATADIYPSVSPAVYSRYLAKGLPLPSPYYIPALPTTLPSDMPGCVKHWDLADAGTHVIPTDASLFPLNPSDEFSRGILCVNAVQQGAGATQRIGNDIQMLKWTLRMHLFVDPSTVGCSLDRKSVV